MNNRKLFKVIMRWTEESVEVVEAEDELAARLAMDDFWPPRASYILKDSFEIHSVSEVKPKKRKRSGARHGPGPISRNALA